MLTKGFVNRLPARQLIGPLYVCNAVVLIPLVPTARWTWSTDVIALHLTAIALMVLTALAVFDLFDHGAASSVTTAQALSPLPATLAVAVLIPGTLEPIHVVAAIVVVTGVLFSLADLFGGLGRVRAIATALVAATGAGTLTVVSKLLAEASVGLAQDYVVRTAVAGVLFLVAMPPHAIRLRREAGGLLLRALFVSTSFSFTILGVQNGNPVVVQTTFATTPLFVVAYEAARERRMPSVRVTAATALVVLGIVGVL